MTSYINKLLFDFEWKYNNSQEKISTCRRIVRPDTPNLELKSFAVLHHFLSNYQYNKKSILDSIEYELQNFIYLVPDFLIKIIKFLNSKDLFEYTKILKNEYKSLLEGQDLTKILLDSVLHWSFIKKPIVEIKRPHIHQLLNPK
jgi:hypothetical protein